MAKYISKEFYKKFSKLIPDLPRKINIMELWDIVGNVLEIEGEFITDNKISKLSFDFRGTTYSVEAPREKVLYIEKSGDVTDIRYEIIIPMALEKIIELKPWKKSKRRNKKEKAV